MRFTNLYIFLSLSFFEADLNHTTYYLILISFLLCPSRFLTFEFKNKRFKPLTGRLASPVLGCDEDTSTSLLYPSHESIQQAFLSFHDPLASLYLSKAILATHFSISLPSFPPENLCPVVPRSIQYLCWVARLVSIYHTICRESAFIQLKVPHNTHNTPSLTSSLVLDPLPFPPSHFAKDVHCMDIGTGASAIFSLLTSRLFGWTVLATDIDPISLSHADKNIAANSTSHATSLQIVSTLSNDQSLSEESPPIASEIHGHEVRKFYTEESRPISKALFTSGQITTRLSKSQLETSTNASHPLTSTAIAPIFRSVLRGFGEIPGTFWEESGLSSSDSETREIMEIFDVCVCNPPFFDLDRLLAKPNKTKTEYTENSSISFLSRDEYCVEGVSKRRSLAITPSEACCEGGEVGFVTRMIDEATLAPVNIKWFTSMLGLQSSIKPIVAYLTSEKTILTAIANMPENLLPFTLELPIIQRLTKEQEREEALKDGRALKSHGSSIAAIQYPIVKTYSYTQGQQTRYAIAWSFCPVFYSLVKKNPLIYAKMMSQFS